MNITFKPLVESDFPLMLKWLTSSHVQSWWDKDIIWTTDLIKQKYSSYVKGYKLQDGQHKEILAYVITVDAVPIGYIQIYNAYDFPRSSKLVDLPKNLATFDIFIGEIDYLSKSIGSSAIELFLKNYCDGKYSHIFVYPDKDNIAAINSYLKAGFEIIKTNDVKNEIWMLKRIQGTDKFIDDYFGDT